MVIEELGRYRITETVGEGPQGTIFRGFDPLLKRPATLYARRVDRNVLDNDDSRSQLLARIKATERLSHPVIATVYDCGLHDDVAYIAVEHFEGRTLDELQEHDRPLPPELAVDIIGNLAEALAYTHRRGVLHLDISPGKITILPSGKPKLSGFGLAALAQCRHSAEPLHETVHYLAPEQFSGKAPDARTDLFSLAVVFYQLLTGKRPFDGDNTAEIMYRIVSKPARRPSRVTHLEHPGFDVILARALAKSPENRYASVADFAADLRQAHEFAAQPLLEWPSGGLASRKGRDKHRHSEETHGSDPDTRGSRPAWRRPLTAGVLLMAAVALIAAINSGLKREEPAPPAAQSTRQEQPAATPETPADTAPLAEAASAPPLAPPPEPIAALSPEPQEIPLPKPENATISLSITPWGEIFIDGQRKGIAPPLTRLEVPPGKVRIEVRNTGAPPFIKELRIGEGKTIQVKHKF